MWPSSRAPAAGLASACPAWHLRAFRYPVNGSWTTENAGDAGTTARQLLIHRTTLYRRLNRVSELCALDIQRSGDDRLAARVGLRLTTLARISRAPDGGSGPE